MPHWYHPPSPRHGISEAAVQKPQRLDVCLGEGKMGDLLHGNHYPQWKINIIYIYIYIYSYGNSTYIIMDNDNG